MAKLVKVVKSDRKLINKDNIVNFEHRSHILLVLIDNIEQVDAGQVAVTGF